MRVFKLHTFSPALHCLFLACLAMTMYLCTTLYINRTSNERDKETATGSTSHHEVAPSNAEKYRLTKQQVSESVDLNDKDFSLKNQGLQPGDQNDKHFFLRKQGLESVDLHEFKSNYIVEPKVYELTSKAPGNRPLKIISCFNCPHWFKPVGTVAYHRDFKICPYSECHFDMDTKRISQAAMVLFFVKPYPSNRPPRLPGQIWVNYVWESPAYNSAGRNGNYHLWKSVFNWTAGYSEDNDLFWPANIMGWRARELLLTFDEYVQIAKQKTRTAAWWSSHCHVQSHRDEYVREMRKYIDVDIYGDCGDGTHRCTGWRECLPLLNTTYKFYLAFENSICKDYLTEKFFRSYQDRTFVLPVVRGGANYEHYFPSSTFINTINFKNAKELALYLKDLGNDHQKYASMMQEKDKLTTLDFKTDWCDICERLHTNKKEKTYPDINNFTLKEGLCWDRRDFNS